MKQMGILTAIIVGVTGIAAAAASMTKKRAGQPTGTASLDEASVAS